MQLSRAVAMRILDLLRERNMTQYRLEKNLGMSHSTMSMILGAHYKGMNIRTLFQIISGLDMTPAEFFDDPIFTREDLEID